MKRLSPTVLLAALLIRACPTPATAVCGDVNGDGSVDIGDALAIAQCDVGLRGCDFPQATPCGGTTTTTLPPIFAGVEPTPDCPNPACAHIRWAQPCDPTESTCAPLPTVAIDRSPDGLTNWTTVLAASEPGQTDYVDSGLPFGVTYYYRLRPAS